MSDEIFVDDKGNKYYTIDKTLETLGMKYSTFMKWFSEMKVKKRFAPPIIPFKRPRHRERYYREEDVQRMLAELHSIHPINGEEQ